MTTTGIVQVQTTLDSEDAASRLADTLVRERLAACVQRLGPLSSTYRWQGTIEQSSEWLCLIKTTTEALPRLLPRLGQLHPYDTPEIIVLPVTDGSDGYLEWVRQAVEGER